MTIGIKAQEVLSPEPQPPELKRGLRLYAGLAAAILSIILPAFVIIVPSLGLPAQWTVILSAGLFIGGPEMLTLAAVLLLGKDTLRYFMYRIKKALWGVVMERPVSKARYYLGLALFFASGLPIYIYGYFPGVLPEGMRVSILVAADLIFVISMFIMGGEFWEKLQMIFVWEGKS
ncbi:MAG TPA: hypothetical protein VN455_07200 [Methanotrichaceae archaeon]|nr:hypothetical protein [Methanotrichaceae archaeon]